jgi:hypothetical protein
MSSPLCSLARCTAVLAMLLCAAPALAQSADPIPKAPSQDRPTTLHVLLGTQAILHSTDMITTAYALRLGGSVREVNPILAPFSGRPLALAAISGAADALQVYTILKVRKRHPKLAMAWAAILVGTEALVVTNNLKVVRELRRTRGSAR